MKQIVYTSKTLESLRAPGELPPGDVAGLIASGWERHPRERRLFLLRREIRAMTFKTVQGFVLPVECDWHDAAVREAVFSG